MSGWQILGQLILNPYTGIEISPHKLYSSQTTAQSPQTDRISTAPLHVLLTSASKIMSAAPQPLRAYVRKGYISQD